jgi:hypothetical protein
MILAVVGCRFNPSHLPRAYAVPSHPAGQRAQLASVLLLFQPRSAAEIPSSGSVSARSRTSVDQLFNALGARHARSHGTRYQYARLQLAKHALLPSRSSRYALDGQLGRRATDEVQVRSRVALSALELPLENPRQPARHHPGRLSTASTGGDDGGLRVGHQPNSAVSSRLVASTAARVAGVRAELASAAPRTSAPGDGVRSTRSCRRRSKTSTAVCSRSRRDRSASRQPAFAAYMPVHRPGAIPRPRHRPAAPTSGRRGRRLSDCGRCGESFRSRGPPSRPVAQLLVDFRQP